VLCFLLVCSALTVSTTNASGSLLTAFTHLLSDKFTTFTVSTIDTADTIFPFRLIERTPLPKQNNITIVSMAINPENGAIYVLLWSLYNTSSAGLFAVDSRTWAMTKLPHNISRTESLWGDQLFFSSARQSLLLLTISSLGMGARVTEISLNGTANTTVTYNFPSIWTVDAVGLDTDHSVMHILNYDRFFSIDLTTGQLSWTPTLIRNSFSPGVKMPWDSKTQKLYLFYCRTPAVGSSFKDCASDYDLVSITPSANYSTTIQVSLPGKDVYQYMPSLALDNINRVLYGVAQHWAYPLPNVVSFDLKSGKLNHHDVFMLTKGGLYTLHYLP